VYIFVGIMVLVVIYSFYEAGIDDPFTVQILGILFAIIILSLGISYLIVSILIICTIKTSITNKAVLRVSIIVAISAIGMMGQTVSLFFASSSPFRQSFATLAASSFMSISFAAVLTLGQLLIFATPIKRRSSSSKSKPSRTSPTSTKSKNTQPDRESIQEEAKDATIS